MPASSPSGWDRTAVMTSARAGVVAFPSRMAVITSSKYARGACGGHSERSGARGTRADGLEGDTRPRNGGVPCGGGALAAGAVGANVAVGASMESAGGDGSGRAGAGHVGVLAVSGVALAAGATWANGAAGAARRPTVGGGGSGRSGRGSVQPAADERAGDGDTVRCGKDSWHRSRGAGLARQCRPGVDQARHEQCLAAPLPKDTAAPPPAAQFHRKAPGAPPDEHQKGARAAAERQSQAHRAAGRRRRTARNHGGSPRCTGRQEVAPPRAPRRGGAGRGAQRPSCGDGRRRRRWRSPWLEHEDETLGCARWVEHATRSGRNG